MPPGVLRGDLDSAAVDHDARTVLNSIDGGKERLYAIAGDCD